MKRILLFSLLLFSSAAHADIFSLNNKNYYDGHRVEYADESILNNLNFAEKQVFNKIYKKQSVTERLERLELAVLGAIQSGNEYLRVQNIAKAVTNVASGGNGLQYHLNDNFNRYSSIGENWSFGGVVNSFGNALGLDDYRYSPCGRTHFHRPHSRFSHYNHLRPKCHCHSHRLPHSRYNNSPVVNGDYLKNYSLGTSVKILDD